MSDKTTTNSGEDNNKTTSGLNLNPLTKALLLELPPDGQITPAGLAAATIKRNPNLNEADIILGANRVIKEYYGDRSAKFDELANEIYKKAEAGLPADEQAEIKQIVTGNPQLASKLGSLLVSGGIKKEQVKAIIALGADVNAQHPLGDTPLTYAIVKGNRERFNELLDAGASVHLKNLNGLTPLATAATLLSNDGAWAIEPLLAKGASPDERTTGRYYVGTYGSNANGSNTLMLAAAHDNEKIVKVLSNPDYKVNLDAQDNAGYTAIAIAITKGSYSRSKIIDVLVDGGASLKVEDLKGKKPIDHARASNNNLIVDQIEKLIYAQSPAKKWGDQIFEELRTTLSEFPEGRYAEIKALTVQHPEYASDLGHRLFDLHALCSYTSDPRFSLPNSWKADPYLGQLPIALLAAGADPNVRDESGRTILTHLTFGLGEFRSGELIGALVAAGVNPDTQNGDGSTALIEAARIGRLGAMSALVEKGATLNLTAGPNSEHYPGYTAAMLAAERGKVEALQFLIGEGADLSIQTVDGRTALTLATKKGHENCAALIQGADGVKPAAAPVRRQSGGLGADASNAAIVVKPEGPAASVQPGVKPAAKAAKLG